MEVEVDKVWTNELAMDNVSNPDQAIRFLKGLGLLIDEDVVRRVVTAMSNGESTCRFWKAGQRDSSICGKGTVSKLKKALQRRVAPPIRGLFRLG